MAQVRDNINIENAKDYLPQLQRGKVVSTTDREPKTSV